MPDETDASTNDVEGYFYEMSDAGNAQRFIDYHGENVRFIEEKGEWAYWTGKLWKLGIASAVQLAITNANEIKAVGKSLARDDSDKEAKKAAEAVTSWGRKSNNKPKLYAALDLASTNPALRMSVGAFDADPLLVNFQNVTVDLRSNVLRPPAKQDLCTQSAAVDFNPDAEAPRFWSFLDQMTARDEEMASYIQRAMGYSITGLNREHKMFMLWGEGRNGKSVLCNLVHRIMGTYSATSQASTWTTDGKRQTIRNDIARLEGKRLVFVSEIQPDEKLNEGLIKQWTGGDTVTARFLHNEDDEFLPKGKVWCRFNHTPRVSQQDEGIWSRFHLIEWLVFVTEAMRNLDLEHELWEYEREGIAAWLVAGAQEYLRIGLKPPQKVKDAVKAYREEEDFLGGWLRECCDIEPDKKSAIGDLYRSYKEWSSDNANFTMSKSVLGKELKRRGFKEWRTTRERGYFGIAVTYGKSLRFTG